MKLDLKYCDLLKKYQAQNKMEEIAVKALLADTKEDVPELFELDESQLEKLVDAIGIIIINITKELA